MKKVISLIMALTLVMGVNASFTPLMKKAVKNAPRLEQVQKQTVAQPATVKHAPKHLRHIDRNVIRKAPMASTTVTLDPATQTPISTEDTQNGAAISLTISGVGIAYNGTLNAATDYSPADFRIFAGKTLTLSASSKIVSVKIAGKANKAGFTLGVDNGTITTGASYDAVTEKANLDDPLIVVDNINATSVVLSMGKQVRAYMIEVTLGEGGTPTPPTPSGDVEIKGLAYADAYYIDGFWDFDIYADDATDYFPEVYFSCYDEAPSQTSIVGTYDVYWAGYWASENDSVLTADEAVGSITVTCVEQGVYNFVGSLEGEDGKTYTWNAQNIEVQAWDDEYNEITLTDGGTPTPPTPGDTTALTMLDAFEFAYYGSYSEEGAYNYTLVLYNSQDENYVPQVGLDIYTEVKDELTGNFTVKGGNLGLEYSAFYPTADSEGESFTDASVTVTEGEGDELTVEGIFTTEAGKTYTFSVTAEPYIYDAEHPYEPQEVKTFNLTAVEGELDETYFAEYGLVYYYLYMEDGSLVGLTYRTANGTQPKGTFAISDEEGADAFLTGMDYYGYADGSYYETVEGDVYYFVSGSVTLATDELGNTTITANATSCYGSTFTITGVIGGKQPSGDHTIVIADYEDVNFTTLDGAYTVASAANGGTAPAYNTNSEDLRLYAKNSMTLTKNTKNGPMTEIVFNISDKGLARQAEITPSVGKMAYDMTKATVTWTGNASEITFTVGDKAVYGTDGDAKAGQFDFTSVDIEGSEYSALDNVKAVKTVKTLMNGQVVIERNGVRYNALGTKF